MSQQPTNEMTTGVVDVGGARLAYRVGGRGIPTIVLASSVYYPRVFSQNLRQRLQLAFVDLRHWVPSAADFDVEQVTLDTYADDIDRIRQTLGHDRVVVIGHSVHASIALEYARRHADHVVGVVAVGGTPVGDEEADAAGDELWASDASPERKRILDRNLAALASELDGLSPGEQFIRRYVARAPSLWYDPEYDCTWTWEGVTFNWPVFERLGSLFESFDLAGSSPIRVPVLVAHGRYDYAAPYTLWEKHKAELPDVEYRLFERSGHFPQFEEPDRFDSAVLGWIHAIENRAAG